MRDFEQLKAKISECASLLQKNAHFVYRCAYIIENIDAPWSHPTLKLIFNDGKILPAIIPPDQLNEGAIE